MSISHDAVASFFQKFAASSNSKDTPAEISHFANVFVAVGPSGSAVVKVEDFEKVLPRRRQLLEASGLVHTSEILRCDGFNRPTRRRQQHLGDGLRNADTRSSHDTGICHLHDRYGG